MIPRQQLVGGAVLAGEGITMPGMVAPGHKVALRAIAQGAPVQRWNQIIGTAKRPIEAAPPTQFVREPAAFVGMRRADGRVATRNFIGVLTPLNCAATVARAIADHVRRAAEGAAPHAGRQRPAPELRGHTEPVQWLLADAN